MTKEQIEQKAQEKYCDGCNRKIEQCVWAWRNVNGKTEPNEENCGCSEVPAYIAGATENGIQWHNLKENPNDLPTCDCETVTLHENGNKNIQKWKNGNWTNAIIIPVIAWYELLKFEEE